MAGRTSFSLACFYRSFLVLLLPASCSFIEDTPDFSNPSFIQFSLKSGVASITVRHLDVFIFETDGDGLLDSYRRVRNVGSTISVASRSGPKRVVLVANADSTLFTVGSTVSYKAFSKIKSRCYDEDPETPIMYAEMLVNSNRVHGEYVVELLPIMSKICLKSFRVDFSATPAPDRMLTDMKAYLINVPASCTLVPAEIECPVDEILNYSGLVGEDVQKMHCKSMIFNTEVENSVFYCYPCTRGEEELGQCAPRLVIEGKAGSSTWYYPVNIGTEKVERGRCYNMYITITRLGMTDPDVAAETGSVSLRFEQKEWNIYENETLDY